MTTAVIRRPLPPGLQLTRGKHSTCKDGMCFNEAIDFITSTHLPVVADVMNDDSFLRDFGTLSVTDHPSAVPRTINRFTMRLNDWWPDADRQLLLPYIPKVIGLSQTAAHEEQRMFLALDWSYRVAMPPPLRLAKFDGQADRLEALAPITSLATREAARELMRTIRDETRVAGLAAREELRKKLAVEAVAAVVEEVAVAVAEAVAAVEAEAEAVAVAVAEAVAVAVAVAAISRTALGSAESGSPWIAVIQQIMREAVATLAPDASYRAVHNAIYWPIRHRTREMILSGEFGSPAYHAYRLAMRDGALALLDRMIAVGAEETVGA